MSIIIELAYPYQELEGIMKLNRISSGVEVLHSVLLNVSCGPLPGIYGQWLVAFFHKNACPCPIVYDLPCYYLLEGTPGRR